LYPAENPGASIEDPAAARLACTGRSTGFECGPPETGVSWTRPEGGLFLWVSVPEHLDTGELFFDAIEHKVAFVPGEQFYGENPERNHMRINFSFVSKEQLAVAVQRLAECIKKRL
jgi:2-aminoadipate transaminase